MVNCLLTHPLLISSFPFLTSAHPYNVSGVNPAILLSESNWNLEPRGCSRLELMSPFPDHTPGVREPRIPYSEGLEALPGLVLVTLFLGSDFRRANYTIIHTSRPKIWMSLDKRLIVHSHVHTLLSRRNRGGEKRGSRLWTLGLHLYFCLEILKCSEWTWREGALTK